MTFNSKCDDIKDEIDHIKKHNEKIPDNQLGMPDHLESVAVKIQKVIDSLVDMKKGVKKAAKGWRGYNSNGSNTNTNKTVRNNNILRTTRKKIRYNNRN